MNALLWAILLSLLPFGELRVGLPVALANGVNPFLAFLVCYAANILVIPVVFFFLEFVHFRFLHHGHYRAAFDLFMERTRKKAHRFVEKYGIFGLALFVAVPLPGTGAYSGALLAWFFGMDKWKAFFSIALGVLIAGLLVAGIFGAIVMVV